MGKKNKDTSSLEKNDSILFTMLKATDFKEVKGLGRDAVIRGNIRVLDVSKDTPWWTIQYVSRGSVYWFADLPVDITERSALALINSLTASNDSGLLSRKQEQANHA